MKTLTASISIAVFLTALCTLSLGRAVADGPSRPGASAGR